MEKRSYKITFGLKEGYEKDGKLHPPEDAVNLITAWMQERVKAERPVVKGLLQDGKLLFPSVEASRKTQEITVAHTMIFTGDLSGKQDAARKNKEVASTLEDLAIKIKNELNQESVFVIYRDKNWCV